MCQHPKLSVGEVVDVPSRVEDSGAGPRDCCLARRCRSHWHRHYIDIADLIDLVRAKGEVFNSEKQTQLAVANMCFAGVADATDVDETKIPCRFWKLGTCRWGARCKWLHDGPAGIATVAKRHPTRERRTNKKSGTHDLRAAADLKAMLLELLSGIATDFECIVQRLLTKIWLLE